MEDRSQRGNNHYDPLAKQNTGRRAVDWETSGRYFFSFAPS